MTISCLIVEDQLPAQRILSRYISELPHLELAGICGNAFEAMAALHGSPIDLMFLDLNMPRLCGFEFLRSLTEPPKIIVTTAYPEHAVEGYDLNVVDYLVKPIAFDRFIRAVDKVRQPFAPEPVPAPFNAAISSAREGRTDEIFVKIENELRRLPLADILFVRADKDYVSIVTTLQRLFVSGPLSSWVERLRSDRFVQVHKSYIVNLAHVSSIRGSTAVTPAGGVPIGRIYREKLLQRVS